MVKRLFNYFVICTLFIQSAFSQPAIDHWETIVFGSDLWRYYVNTTSYPPAGWYQNEFDDSAWPAGAGGFGYADYDDLTEIPFTPYPVSVHIRINFDIQDTSLIELALLHMDYDDGFIAWINGFEIARSNMGSAGQDPATSFPAVDHEAVMYQGQTPPQFMVFKKKLRQCLVNGTNVLAVQVNNYGSSSSDMTCRAFFSVGLKSTGSYYNKVPWWFVEPYTGNSESYLPLVIVFTNGNSIIPDNKVTVDMGVIDNGPGMLNHTDDPWNGYSGKAGIEFRGSSSLAFPKKNYGFETRTILGEDSVVSLLGMPPESDWVLHGPYSDKSLIRNRLAYDLARDMGNYAPRARFCELYVDYYYQGLYVLIERIKRDSTRVAIARLDTSDVVGNDLTGGYIIKIDRSADGSYTDGWFSKYKGSGSGDMGPFFAWHYPKWEDILPVQQNYIRNRINRFEDALFGSDYRDPYIGYRNYINVQTFIDYFILVELSKNVDGYRLSTFLHKDRDDRDPLIKMGPVWDYDLAFGNADYYYASVVSGWNYPIEADGWGTPYWWTRFLSDEYFRNNLNCRWKQLREDVLSDERLMEVIDAYVDTMDEAIGRNFTQWPIHGQYVWPNAFVGNNYTEDINFMKNWILQRAQWMDLNMPGNCATPVDDIPHASFSLLALPNPAVEWLNLEIYNPLQKSINIEIVNTSGIRVNNETTGTEQIIHCRIRLNPGVYIVNAVSEGERLSLKVLIQ